MPTYRAVARATIAASLAVCVTAVSAQPASPAADARALVLRRDEVMTRTPVVNVPGVKVWSMRRHGTARTNLVEFSGRAPMHQHPDADHTLLVLEGALWVRAGADEVKLSAGDYISIPPNMPHGYWVDPGARALLVSFDAPAYDEKKTVWLEDPARPGAASR